MQNLIKDGMGILLKSIDYIGNIASDNKHIDYTDEFNTIIIEKEVAEFEIVRNVDVDLRTAYKLKIAVRIQVHAKSGIDLTQSLTEDLINKNKVRLSDLVMSYMASLISQITGSFNGYPIITSPKIRLSKENNDK